MTYEIVIPEIVLPKFSNQAILELSVLLFLLFAIAEICGAFLSGSLSLLADSISMFTDIISYICNIYVEWYKSKYGGVSRRSRFYLEVIIPILSVLLLVGTTLYTTYDALSVIWKPPDKNDVNVNFMYGFSLFNFFIDFACWLLFSLRGKDTFLEPVQVPQLSIDTTVSFDEEEDFGELEDSEFESLKPEEDDSKFFAFTEFWKLITCQKLTATQLSAAENTQEKKSNLNMLSAFAHIAGDTLRTIAVLIAALTSTIFRIDADICDAFSALLASLTILIICGSLIAEIRKSYQELREDDSEEVVFRSSPFSAKSSVKPLYMQVSGTDDNDI
jgi:cation diffusion facilitator family transporter